MTGMEFPIVSTVLLAAYLLLGLFAESLCGSLMWASFEMF